MHTENIGIKEKNQTSWKIIKIKREKERGGERERDRRTWKYEIPMANECLLLNKLASPVSKENKWDVI